MVQEGELYKSYKRSSGSDNPETGNGPLFSLGLAHVGTARGHGHRGHGGHPRLTAAPVARQAPGDTFRGTRGGIKLVCSAEPDALENALGKAERADIPVVGPNSGQADRKRFGPLEFFGRDESVAGEAFGNKLNTTGAELNKDLVKAVRNGSIESAVAAARGGITHLGDTFPEGTT
ncbi:hypothetical protein [Streptomyces sp. WP-1]|uniref:hypothetical protein n=1 Tax=Streptomyces sp. WP-1 TaxID=3041497 RepID=UPI00351B26EA